MTATQCTAVTRASLPHRDRNRGRRRRHPDTRLLARIALEFSY